MTADIAAIRARWAAVWGVGDWTRWTAADLGSVCHYSTATLTAVLHAPDDVRALLHEARVLREQRDRATDHANQWRAVADDRGREAPALHAERDAARGLACDLASQQPVPGLRRRLGRAGGRPVMSRTSPVSAVTGPTRLARRGLPPPRATPGSSIAWTP